MKQYIKEENEYYVVYIQRELGMVPILKTKRRSEAELMLNYLTNV